MQQRSPESEVLILCARQRMTDSCADRVLHLCRTEGFQWSRLLQTSVSHQVAPLVLTNLLKINGVANLLPPAISKSWQNVKIRNILAKKNQARIVRQILEFFTSRSLRVMLIKGAALDAVVYAEPWYIQSDDADLLVEMPFDSLAPSDLTALGTMMKGLPVELDFARHHDVDMNHLLDTDYVRLWADARPVSIAATPGYMMSPEDMLLTACTNLCRKRYQQLKGMVAVREILLAYPDLDWEKVARNAISCGAHRIVYTSLKITSLVLECTVPAQAMAGLRVDWARRGAINHLCGVISANLFPLPKASRRWSFRYFATLLLRLASYRRYHWRREVKAQMALKRFRAMGSPSLRTGF